MYKIFGEERIFYINFCILVPACGKLPQKPPTADGYISLKDRKIHA
jgi:hypothetical protein